jgi:hypothetical protein
VPPRRILLPALLAYSAYARTRSDLEVGTEAWSAVLQAWLNRQAAAEIFLRNGEIGFRGLDELIDAIKRHRDDRITFLGSEFGSIKFSGAAVRAAGCKVVTPYWGLAQDYQSFAHRCGMETMPVEGLASAAALFSALEAAERRGLLPFLTLEAPSPTNKRYRFLGFSIRCSRFAELHSRRRTSVVFLLWSHIRDDLRIEIGFRVFPEIGRLDTQCLLSTIDELVARSPENYAWENAGVLSSDANAFRAGAAILPDLVNWWETRSPQDSRNIG